MFEKQRRSLRRRVGSALPEELATVLRAAAQPPAPWDEAAVLLAEVRREGGEVAYPQYLYGLATAARTARALGVEQFVAIEFGVAGGNGLVAMEHHAAWIEARVGVRVDIHGFDAGNGLPPSTHELDSVFAFGGGEFVMDESALRRRLSRSTLWIGDVRDRVADFMAHQHHPIGFVSHDFDYYTSTRDALAIFEQPVGRLLPRVANYFDDLSGYPYSSITGEWRAIAEFNERNPRRQLGHVHGLQHQLPGWCRFASWNDLIFVLHVFDHEGYNEREPQTGAYERPLQ